jgi:hypothetical protein
VRTGERGRRRTVPGGDPAAYVRQQIQSDRGESAAEADPGRIRIAAPARQIRERVPERYADVEPDGDSACVVTTRGAWSRSFLIWMATLDEPMKVLGPPQLVEVARNLVARLTAAAA